ncbi:methionyl-tRNA formyltransferase [Alkalithermobacter thermoalcaliphilus JW-YL-7 = DSM 7308]|uniref:Methionyl-tRNA formyltransferase n=2 Tax=Clostridium paradoxum TaxID=29346 RepID=A0A150FPQ0_CLOPD|nr:Methionyl-tRNA formyltransferase [[Clostridium] paradoxum JW-YL-7 = DSM 7308]SHK96508.1 methionyl-tRNA formyltransferase [[Clostridium] paradoxum JW-YL-7 = DSM 7308]
MGTPDFAVPSLKMLIEEGYDIISVVTQPDKPKGRGNKITYPPVKQEALNHGIKVYQPSKVKDKEFVDILKQLNPDIIIVIAFGQILSKDILSIPKHGCINVHSSLLPKYRGAAPINWAIINGEEVTGVTTMYMDEGLDTGDMILKIETKIGDEETAGELHDRLSVLGAKVLSETLNLIKKGTVLRQKQDDSQASYAPIMDKNLGNINWNKSAQDIFNLIRGTNPWPSAFTNYKASTMKIWKAKVIDKDSNLKPGTILDVSSQGISVACKKGTLLVEDIQMPGKKRMPVHEYIKGNTIEKGVVLGE